MTALRAEGCGGGFAADFKKRGRGSAAGCVEGLCSLRSGGDSPAGLRVVDCPSGNAYKVSVTGFTFGIIWRNKHYNDQPPPVAFPPFGALRHHLPSPLGSVSLDSQSSTTPCESSSLATAERWDNKDPQSNPFISRNTISTDYSATACGVASERNLQGGRKATENFVRRFPVEKSREAGKGEAITRAERGWPVFHRPPGRLSRF